MSKWMSNPVPYKCSYDCQQMGCPGHILTLEFDRSSDYYRVWVDGNAGASYDEEEFHALLRAVEQVGKD